MIPNLPLNMLQMPRPLGQGFDPMGFLDRILQGQDVVLNPGAVPMGQPLGSSDLPRFYPPPPPRYQEM